MKVSMSERHKFVIRIFAAVGLLTVVFSTVDLEQTLSLLARADGMTLLAGLLLVQVQIILSAQRWRFTAHRLGHEISQRLAVGEYYLASLLNLVLPGGVSGDVLRAARLARAPDNGSVKATTIVRAVVLERLAGQIAFFLIALFGFVGWSFVLGSERPDGLGRVAIVALAVFALVVITPALLAKAAPQSVRHWFENITPDIEKAWFAGTAWITQGILSLSIAALYVAVFALCSAAVGAPLSLLSSLTLVPAVLLTMLVPASIGGFGMREGAAAALWPVVGYTAADGLAAALLYGMICIVGALPGLWWFVSPRLRRAAHRCRRIGPQRR